MAFVASEPVEQVRNDFAGAIRTRRSDRIPTRPPGSSSSMTTQISSPLVGGNQDCDQAVLHHQQDRYAIAVEFGPDGLADGGTVVGVSRAGPGVERWVEKMGAYWGWIHPRYR